MQISSKLFIFSILCIAILLCCSRKSTENDYAAATAVKYIQNKGYSSFGMDYTDQKYTFSIKYPAKDDFGKNFVSAFVISALSESEKKPEIFNETVKMLLKKKGPSGLWSFDDHGISTDSDTTLTVLLSLIQSGAIDNEAISQTLSTIESKYLRSCGLASIDNSGKHSNFGVHLEPTANFLFILASKGKKSSVDNSCIADEILKRQNSDGSFIAYWYPSRFFATFLAVRALSAYIKDSGQQKIIRESLLKASEFILKNKNSDGGWGEKSNALDTSLAIMTVGMIDEVKHSMVILEGLNWLRSSQNPDGSWNGSVIFNYYYTQCESRSCPEPWHDINRKLISTSLAVKTLRTFSNYR